LSSTNTVLNGVQFKGNQAVKGGGLYLVGGSTLTINDLNVDGSQATADGGFLYVENSAASAINLALTGSPVIKNTQATNGGVFYIDSSNAYLDLRVPSYITNINASGKGGIAYISKASKVDIYSGTFTNVYSNSSGSMIYSISSATVYTIKNTIASCFLTSFLGTYP